MNLPKSTLILLILAVAISAVGVAIAVVSWSISFSGTVVAPQTSGLECYQTDGTTKLYSIGRGNMEQGKSYTYNFIVKNTGTTTLTLQLNLPNNAWTTGSSGTVSWNREGYSLSGGTSVTPTFTWQISSIAATGSTGTITMGVEGS